jgi:hypothetical protein
MPIKNPKNLPGIGMSYLSLRRMANGRSGEVRRNRVNVMKIMPTIK